MELKLKPISKTSIPAALEKVQLYRYLNEPEEAESICRDILAAETGHQLALRMLGLAITDQFTGSELDRYAEAQQVFDRLTDSYERLYYSGLLAERRAKAQLHAGRLPHTLRVLFEDALHCFAEAEKIRHPDNDEAILRWNRCVRLLHSLPQLEAEFAEEAFEPSDSPPR